jgi:N-acetylmuramoyl-L-alanine amidase
MPNSGSTNNMTLICLQAGHYGRTSGATGTDGEQALNWRITLALTEILISKGFVVQIVGGDPAQSEISKDFDLFLALHGDMNTSGEGGCIGYIDPAVDSSAESNAKSKAIKEAIQSVYFQESGIKDNPNKVTYNITRYYMWARLSAKTPCVLLEMGEVKDPHDSVILADTKIVAVAIAKGICKAFNVNYEPVLPDPITPPQPADPCASVKAELETTKKALYDAERSYSASLAVKEEECKQKLESYKYRLAVELEKSLKKTIEETI